MGSSIYVTWAGVLHSGPLAPQARIKPLAPPFFFHSHVAWESCGFSLKQGLKEGAPSILTGQWVRLQM